MPPIPTTSRPPATRIMRHLGLEPDPWQLEVLESDHPRQLRNCSHRAGKSTVVAARALADAVFRRAWCRPAGWSGLSATSF